MPPHGKHEYLRSVIKDSPVGRRYLGSLVFRLKFELGIAFSMLSAALGLLWLLYLGLNRMTFAWIALSGLSKKVVCLASLVKTPPRESHAYEGSRMRRVSEKC
jgi:hypothetical protein